MDGSKVLSEMDTVLNAVSATADAADALPFESIDDFSTDPVSFAEMSERMLEKVEYIFDLSAIYNRYSDEYLKICAILEKGIKYLASSCITKAALDQAKKNIPTLGQLSLEKLYGMASFNYRKLDTALTEQLKSKGRDFSPELLDMDFRYYHLLLRLRATEQKKHDYFQNYYYGSNGNYLTHMGKAFNNGVHSGPESEPPVFRKAPAFPINKEEIIELQAKQYPEAQRKTDLSLNTNTANRVNPGTNAQAEGKNKAQDEKEQMQQLSYGRRGNIQSAPDHHHTSSEFVTNDIPMAPVQKQAADPAAEEHPTKKISAAQLQKEIDDEMKKTWARFTAYIEEGRKGSSAPPGR